MTFSPVDNELLLSEIDMMEVYGGTGDAWDPALSPSPRKAMPDG